MSPPLFHSIAVPNWPNVPPWFVIDGRSLSELLGVTTQTLCEWRRRGIGPSPEPDGLFRPAQGRKKWYALNQVMSWTDSLQSIERPPWEYDGEFLKARLSTSKELSKYQIEYLKKADWSDFFEELCQPRKRAQ